MTLAPAMLRCRTILSGLSGLAATGHIGIADYAKYLRPFMSAGGGGGFVSPDAMARIATAPVAGEGQYGIGWMVYGRRPWAQRPAIAHKGSNMRRHAVSLLIQYAPV